MNRIVILMVIIIALVLGFEREGRGTEVLMWLLEISKGSA